MSNKLEGIPSIYYLNLDSELDRRKYMERQFEKWNLTNIRRFSGSQYLAENYEDWIEYIEDRPFNDKRYYISNQKVKDLGWTICTDFDSGLNEVIEQMSN
jgi:dTDP-D-glucose 4,6-dehydratase